MTTIALIIGINYTGTSSQLFGCINDAMNLKTMLQQHYNYTDENIVLMTDETDVKPTKQNIMVAMTNLLLRVQQENVKRVWISYSGHGSNVRDTEGDEKDRRDETIVPLDFDQIEDDVLYHMVSLLQLYTECICLFDSCHSGSVLDLAYQYNPKKNTFFTENTPTTFEHLAIMISGCQDNEYSEESWVGQQQGAMTTTFIYLLQKYNFKVSFKQLINEMNTHLHTYGFKQQPRLTCNKQFDMNMEIDLH